MVSPVRTRSANLLLALVLWAVTALLVEHLYQLERGRAAEDLRTQVMIRAAARGIRLGSDLNAAVFISNGLVGYVTAYDDLLEPDRVMTALEVIHRSGHHVRNVALAPDNVIRFIYPLQGNREAIGLDYTQTPDQWPGVRSAIEQRETVLTGPLDLVQGGTALIARTPVFRNDDRYWGMLSVVIDPRSLFDAAGLLETDSDIRYAIRVAGAQPGPIVLGSPELFLSDPVVHRIAIPGGAWELGAVPAAGWDRDPAFLPFYRLGGHIVVFVVALLVFIVLEERYRITRMALHDPLTRLPNRRRFEYQLEREASRAGRESGSLALVYIDLNGFKAVNDRFGHATGDRVLAGIAGRMAEVLKKREFLARVGGDEFVAILPGAANETDVRNRIGPLRDAIRTPLPGLPLEKPLDAAFGVAFYPRDGHEPEQLLQAADSRMYLLKTDTGG